MSKYLFPLFILAMFLGLSYKVHAQEYAKSTIEVNGTGEVTAKPDIAYLNIAVETSSKNASEAVRENAVKTQQVIKNVKAAVGEKDKIKTTNYNLSPVYEYDNQTKKQYLKEYRVINEVQVEIYNLENMGNLIDTATSTGANRINGPSFGIKNSSDLEREALKLAVADARKTAETVATASGTKIVKILRINPSYSIPAPYYNKGFQTRALAAESAPTPIETGDLTVSANVTIVYEIQ